MHFQFFIWFGTKGNRNSPSKNKSEFCEHNPIGFDTIRDRNHHFPVCIIEKILMKKPWQPVIWEFTNLKLMKKITRLAFTLRLWALCHFLHRTTLLLPVMVFWWRRFEMHAYWYFYLAKFTSAVQKILLQKIIYQYALQNILWSFRSSSIRCFNIANQKLYFVENKPCDWLKHITKSVSANRMVCLLQSTSFALLYRNTIDEEREGRERRRGYYSCG